MKRSKPLTRRTPLRSRPKPSGEAPERAPPAKPRKGLRRRSAKTEATYAGPDGRRALVARLLAERPVCEGGIEGVCTGRSVDVHERLARSAGGSILDVDNLMCLCRACHTWVGDHPRDAIRLGLRLSRYPGRNP